MSDLPLEGRKSSKVTPKPEQKLEITKENAALVQAYYSVEIYKRLGYLIKVLEGKK